MYLPDHDGPSSACAPDLLPPGHAEEARMQAAVLDREARTRQFVSRLLRELRLLGYQDDQLRGRSVVQLLQLRQQGYRHLMETPPSRHAA